MKILRYLSVLISVLALMAVFLPVNIIYASSPPAVETESGYRELPSTIEFDCGIDTYGWGPWMYDAFDDTPYVHNLNPDMGVYAYASIIWNTPPLGNGTCESIDGSGNPSFGTCTAENTGILADTTGVTLEFSDCSLTGLQKINWGQLGSSFDRRNYSGGTGTIKVNGVPKLIVTNARTTMDVSWTAPAGNNTGIIGSGWGTIDMVNSDPAWVAEFDNGNGQVEFVYDSFSPVIQGCWGYFTNHLTVRGAPHVEEINQLPVIQAGILNFPEANITLNVNSFDNGGPNNDQNLFFANQIFTDPGGAAPAGILEVLPGCYWELSTVLDAINTDITFVLTGLADLPEAENLRVLWRENAADPWTALPTLVDGTNVRINGVIQTGLGEFALGEAVVTNWLTDWLYRKVVNITGSTTELTNYQVMIPVDFVNNKMSGNFSDIRFTDTDGNTLLSYWTENYTEPTAANIWVKVPSIPVVGKIIYMYYGNPQATSVSNGDDTFLLFDHFEGTVLDTNKWGVVTQGYMCRYEVSNSILKVEQGGDWDTVWHHMLIGSNAVFGPGHALGVKVAQLYESAVSGVDKFGYIKFGSTEPFNSPNFGSNWGSTWKVLFKNNPNNMEHVTQNNGIYTGNEVTNKVAPFNLELTWASDESKLFYDRQAENTINTNIPGGNYKVLFDVTGGNNPGTVNIQLDWTYVRNYVSQEPVAAFGAEEIGQASLTVNKTGSGTTTPAEGSHLYPAGTIVPLTAAPAGGYLFANWTGDVSTVANVTNPATNITMNGNKNITANFIPKTGPVHNTNTGGNFATIQEAINAANTLNGNTLTVDAGTYSWNVDVNKEVIIRSTSDNPNDTIINAANENDHIFDVTANNVTIRGFTVRGTGVTSNKAGICLNNVTGCTIENNHCGDTLSDNDLGILLYRGGQNLIVNNSCIDDNYGISLEGSSGNTIKDNFMQYSEYSDINLEYSPYPTGSNNNIIEGNQCLDGGGTGIYIYFSNGNSIIDNYIADKVSSSGIELYNSDANIITRNTVSSIQYAGSAAGIKLGSTSSTSDNNIVYLNTLVLNDNNITVASGCTGNRFYSPVEINYVYLHKGFYSYLGNYYDDYTGIDGVNDDGIGEIAYLIANADSDNFPLTAVDSEYLEDVLTLTVCVEPEEGGNTNPLPGQYGYAAGEIVNLIATPNAGWEFVNWSGDVSTVADINAASTNITMSDDFIVIANFLSTGPSADFIITPGQAALNQPVTFDAMPSSHNDPQHSIVTYEWDFDVPQAGIPGTDPAIVVQNFTAEAQGKFTTHSYSELGTYYPVLKVIDDQGKTDYCYGTTRAVTVYTDNIPPVADAGGPYTADIEGGGITFDGSGSTGNIVTYQWNIAYGTYLLSGQKPSLTGEEITALGTGLYTVDLVVIDSNSISSSLSRTTLLVDINRPIASFIMNPNPAVCDQPVSFDASASYSPIQGNSISKYNWDFGDGANGTGTVINHSYSSSGNYTVTLTVTDNSSPVKTNKTSQNIRVNLPAVTLYTLVVNISPAGGGTVTRNPDELAYSSGTSVQLTANSSYGYRFVNWSGNVTGTDNPHTVIMDGNKTITANFLAIISGDANEDGVVDVLDMTKVVRIILEIDPETPGADANQDGVVNVLDISKIARIILGLN